MIFLLIRLAVFFFLIYGVYHVVQFGVQAYLKYNACPRCDGHGYWEGLRGREKCEACKGSGKMPKQLKP